MRYNSIIILLLLSVATVAQIDLPTFLSGVETNNLQLQAEKQKVVGVAIEVHTGNSLPNPTISYDKMGSGSGSYSEMVVSQGFDFPSTYLHKSKIAKLKVSHSESELSLAKLEYLTLAGKDYMHYVYLSKVLDFVAQKDSLYQILDKNAKKQLELGDVNVIEANRISREAIESSEELTLLEVKLKAAKNELVAQNGGVELDLSSLDYPEFLTIDNMEETVATILAKHPKVKISNSNVILSERAVGLSKAEGLPSFEVGYRQDVASENTVNGFVVGMSIPLFENKNRVKLAKAQHQERKYQERATELELKKSVSNLLLSYSGTKTSAQNLLERFNSSSDSDLLFKAYQHGQISYSEFFTEFESYIHSRLFVEEIHEKAMLYHVQLWVLLNY